MKKLLILFLTVLMFSGIVSETLAKKKQGKQLYTAYNIWLLKEANLKCINFKVGKKILPAGTPANEVKIVNEEISTNTYAKKIRFALEGQRRRIRIGFESRYHRGIKINAYLERMFTEKTFEEQTAGMTEKEIAAIQNGVLVEGMSKKAVLMSYGYPPEHKTPSTEDNDWIYWMSKKEIKKICFDENQRTVRCEKRQVIKSIKIEDTL